LSARTGQGRDHAKGREDGAQAETHHHQKREALKALADGMAMRADSARRFNVSYPMPIRTKTSSIGRSCRGHRRI
jgi:hypothetical protein